MTGRDRARCDRTKKLAGEVPIVLIIYTSSEEKFRLNEETGEFAERISGSVICVIVPHKKSYIPQKKTTRLEGLRSDTVVKNAYGVKKLISANFFIGEEQD